MNHFSVVHSTALDLRLTGSDLQRLWRSVVFAWSMLPVSSACLDTKHKAVKEQFGKIVILLYSYSEMHFCRLCTYRVVMRELRFKFKISRYNYSGI